METLRIFISSPGDVKQERIIAKKVISDLSRIYREYVRLEPILWEDLPLEVTNTFQDGIDYFLNQAPIDIAIFILWSRLGSKLSSSFLKPDGSVYSSGTEYEFDMMYTLWKENKKPKIMVYVKDVEPQYEKGLKSSDIRELLDQKDKLDHFIEEKFKDRENGSNYAYWQFEKQQTFEERLRTHLTRLIHDRIGRDINIREWEGNPYVGLKSYDMNESAIFFGRRDMVYDISGNILKQIDEGIRPTLFVLGESGSGKSSMIKAGVLPQIIGDDVDDGNFIVEFLTPSMFRGKVYSGLVDIILKYFPSLEKNPVYDDLKNGVSDNYDFKYLQYALVNESSGKIPVIFIDQFEELFSDNLITEDERCKTLHLLRGICETRQVLMMFSMRNDFYNRFTSYPELGVIKNLSYIVDVPKVSAADVTEIIEEPAHKAKLRWERNAFGVSLSKKIIEDACKLQNLPLIEFALAELYKECESTEELTYDAYNRIGCLNGAVIQYANKFYSSLSLEEQEAFRGLLGMVVTIDKDTLFVRKTSLRKNIEKTPLIRTLVQKLIDAHLFVSGKDTNGESTVTFVHEVLLNSWDVVKEWTCSHIDFLRRNDHYEKLALYWNSNGSLHKDLILERSALLEAEYFMYHHEKDLQPITFNYINQSLLSQRREGLIKHIFLFAGVVLLSIGSFLLMLQGTTSDSDTDKQIGVSEFTWFDALSLIIPLLVVSAHSLFLRIKRKYIYKTIFKSAVLWGGVMIITTIVAIYDAVSGKVDAWYYSLWPLPYIICGFPVIMEWLRRKYWNKNIFKPYLIADKYETAKKLILWSVASLFIISILGIYLTVISEKNEKLKNIVEEINVLYDALNSVQLSWSDRLSINRNQAALLIEYYEDELKDKIPDRMEGAYAVCLYNLYDPYQAIQYLYPDNYWDHHCIFTQACLRSGLYDLTAHSLEQYVRAKRLNDVNWISHTALIWTAEKVGRFDIADSIYSVMKQNNVEWDYNDYCNYAHIQLMKGEMNDAVNLYNRGEYFLLQQNSMLKEDSLRNVWRNSLSNDFNVMRWLNVGNQDYINVVAKKLDIHIRNFYTSVSDSVATDKIHDKLIGKWALSDSSIVINIHPVIKTCQYIFMNNKKEQGRVLTNCRFSEADGHIYWEELDQESNTVSSGEIISITDSMFSVKIIENGNSEDSGTTRNFHRVYENKTLPNN